ncbi:hypothetical protein PROFUN_02729, partial [Planoprotostelium fungivorum]
SDTLERVTTSSGLDSHRSWRFQQYLQRLRPIESLYSNHFSANKM